MEINTNIENNYDFQDIIKLFIPQNFEEYDMTIDHEEEEKDEKIFNHYKIKIKQEEFEFDKVSDASKFISPKSFAKIGLYEALSKIFDKEMPYGALTGIRPVKFCYDLFKKGLPKTSIKNFLMKNYHVSEEKVDLIIDIIINQSNLELNDKLVDFYVNIPFCPTRCAYCSFISMEIGKAGKLADEYVDKLVYEIEKTKQFLMENYYIVKSVYIGGGTPTSLTDSQLEKILQSVSFKVKEFTVEAGRPDTITKEKLDLLQKYGVTRISINPQTFNDKVLTAIGRKHSAMDALNAYKLARTYNFDINMDLIMGLNKDTIKGFKETMDICCYLRPDNITIHTLALKRASKLKENNENIFKNETKVLKMSKLATKMLKENGYKPYYLYRQKNMVSGLENVGYFVDNKICYFNIDSMDELSSIVACGANGISKRVFSLTNRIERFANVKDIKEYCSRIDEMIEKKRELFSESEFVKKD
ncbi:MAG: coproporphyrinogen dehydrogenase HemZ [Christensenellales bacterium]